MSLVQVESRTPRLNSLLKEDGPFLKWFLYFRLETSYVSSKSLPPPLPSLLYVVFV